MQSLPFYYALLFLLIPSVDACLRVVPPEPGIPPAIPCKTCADKWVTVTQLGIGSIPMDPAVTVRTNGCARRTFTCRGNNATIRVFSAFRQLESVTDQGTGTAVLIVTCNGAGTAWEHGGEKVVRVECTTTPAVEPTLPTPTAPTATVPTATVPTATVPTATVPTATVPTATVPTATVPTATVPTATVPTATVPTATVPTATVPTSTVPTATVPTPTVPTSSMPTPTMPTPTVPTSTVPTATVPTSTVPTATVPTPTVPTSSMPTPAMPTPTVPTSSMPTPTMPTPTVPTSSMPTPTMPTATVPTSTVPTATVPTPTVPTSSMPTPAMPTPTVPTSSMPTPTMPTPTVPTSTVPTSSMATPTVSTAVDPPCTMCDRILISNTTLGANSIPMDNDEILMEGGCSLRRFTCKGTMASIAVFGPGGEIGNFADGDDGNVDGTATFTVECNETGTAWETGGMEITRVECTAIPLCKQCVADRIAVSQAALNPKRIDRGMIDYTGNCAMQTFMCMGTNATIALKSGGVALQPITIADTGTATLAVTCNEAGTGWDGANRINITEVTCSAVPPCKQCDKDMITKTVLGHNSKQMDDDRIFNTGNCSTRTFTCKGILAQIVYTAANGQQYIVTDGGSGTATYNVTCNAEGKRWMAGGMVITHVECRTGPPCQKCESELITKTRIGANSTEMDEDIIRHSGACARRTFVCRRSNAMIITKVNGKRTASVFDYEFGFAMQIVHCAADGKRWEVRPGKTITEVECAETQLCERCDKDLITMTERGPNAKRMDNDEIRKAGQCATRTFTCNGDMAEISITATNGVKSKVTDDGTGTAAYTVTCNADGTRWMAGGMVIANVECSTGLPCQKCTKDLITMTRATMNDRRMDGDVVVREGACALRTLTCRGKPAMIELKSAIGPLPSVSDAGTNTATLNVTCNATGTGWESGGTAITEVACSAIDPCTTCTRDQLVASFGMNAIPFDRDVILSHGRCALRRLTCIGTHPSIFVKLDDRFPGQTNAPATRSASVTLTCNAAGTRWTYGGRIVTEIECRDL